MALNTYKYSQVHQLTFEPRSPLLGALTLAVQHVAAAAEKEQEEKTPAPTPGHHPHHHHAPCCGSLHPLWGANSRLHHAVERGGPTVSVSACALLQLSLYLCLSLMGRSPSESSSSAKLRAPGVQRPSLPTSSPLCLHRSGVRTLSRRREWRDTFPALWCLASR